MKQFFNKKVVLAAGLAAICGTSVSVAAAQTTETQAVDAAIACRDITDDLQRLACLDSAAETLAVTRIIREEEIAEKKKEERESFGLAKKGNDDDAPPTLAATTEEEFGGEYLPENIKKRDETRLKQITANIAEIRVNRYGKVTLTLENGQVWRQLDSDNKLLRFPKKSDKLYSAKVKRSTFGNYLLTVKELSRTIRVRRVE